MGHNESRHGNFTEFTNLSPTDLLQREGKYPVPPQAPTTLGVEFSGIIESLGNDAETKFHPGDEVFGLAYGGESLLEKTTLGRS